MTDRGATAFSFICKHTLRCGFEHTSESYLEVGIMRRCCTFCHAGAFSSLIQEVLGQSLGFICSGGWRFAGAQASWHLYFLSYPPQSGTLHELVLSVCMTLCG